MNRLGTFRLQSEFFMQGILMSHFKQVKKYLFELQQVEQFELPCNHLADIVEHENKLAIIYENYKAALVNVQTLINEFDDHKKSVRRLIIEHKRCKKLGKEVDLTLFQ